MQGVGAEAGTLPNGAWMQLTEKPAKTAGRPYELYDKFWYLCCFAAGEGRGVEGVGVALGMEGGICFLWEWGECCWDDCFANDGDYYMGCVSEGGGLASAGRCGFIE